MKRHIPLIIATSLVTPSAFLAAAEFVEIESGTSLYVGGISADGNVVVGYTIDDSSDRMAYTWSRETGFNTLGALPGHSRSQAYNVSADGSVVVGWSSDATGNSELFLWTGNEGMTGLGVTGGGRSAAISDDGSVVVSNSDGEVIRWTEVDGAMSLVPPGAIRSRSGGMNLSADGAVVAVESIGGDGKRDGFIWDEANGFQHLGAKPSGWDDVAPEIVAANGSVVFGTDSEAGGFVGRPFRWTEQSGIEPLPLLPGTTRAQVDDLIPDGSIMVGFGLTSGGNPQRTAFVWDEKYGTRNLRELLLTDHGFSEQDLPQLERARGISDDGMTIVGTNDRFANSDDFRDAWAIYLDKPLVSFGPSVLLPGDYNNNGTVEQADLDLVLLHWGADASAVPDTWTNDLPTGAIDQDELDAVLLNWGNMSTSSVISAAVPEPSGAMIMVMLAIGAFHGVGSLFSRREDVDRERNST